MLKKKNNENYIISRPGIGGAKVFFSTFNWPEGGGNQEIFVVDDRKEGRAKGKRYRSEWQQKKKKAKGPGPTLWVGKKAHLGGVSLVTDKEPRNSQRGNKRSKHTRKTHRGLNRVEGGRSGRLFPSPNKNRRVENF